MREDHRNGIKRPRKQQFASRAGVRHAPSLDHDFHRLANANHSFYPRVRIPPYIDGLEVLEEPEVRSTGYHPSSSQGEARSSQGSIGVRDFHDALVGKCPKLGSHAVASVNKPFSLGLAIPIPF